MAVIRGIVQGDVEALFWEDDGTLEVSVDTGDSDAPFVIVSGAPDITAARRSFLETWTRLGQEIAASITVGVLPPGLTLPPTTPPN